MFDCCSQLVTRLVGSDPQIADCWRTGGALALVWVHTVQALNHVLNTPLETVAEEEDSSEVFLVYDAQTLLGAIQTMCETCVENGKTLWLSIADDCTGANVILGFLCFFFFLFLLS